MYVFSVIILSVLKVDHVASLIKLPVVSILTHSPIAYTILKLTVHSPPTLSQLFVFLIAMNPKVSPCLYFT